MSKTKVAAITELVRKVDYHLLKLDLNLKVTDAAQLTTKKPLLTALQQCKEVRCFPISKSSVFTKH